MHVERSKGLGDFRACSVYINGFIFGVKLPAQKELNTM
jgi:hypothetical protein